MEKFPAEQRLKFFVYVVESPSPVDLYHDRSEADFIQKAVLLNRIPCARRVAVNSEAFLASLAIGLRDEIAAYKGLIPILHISAHGSSEGIQLSSGELITWDQLQKQLIPINQALQGNLLVCMSTCEGYAGIRMAMDADAGAQHAYFALVGNGYAPTWPETAVAFATLYHQLACGYHLNDAVQAMRVASGNDHFFLAWASQTRQDFIQYITNHNAAQAAAALTENSESKPTDAKFSDATPATPLAGS